MTKQQQRPAAHFYLGIECGGTRTTALMQRSDTGAEQRWEGGPANLRLISDVELLKHFRRIRRALPSPTSIAIGMAGARTRYDVERVTQAANLAWPGVPCWASHDLDIALAAAPEVKDTSAGTKRFSRSKIRSQVLVLSGTGSCCLGRSTHGRSVKIGGWGHILGDKGSAHDIAIRALKAVIYYWDRDQEWSCLGRQILRRLLLNQPDDLIDWVKSAGKAQVAALATEVFSAAEKQDRIARDILTGAAASLAKDALDCARRLAHTGERLQFVLAGSVLLRQKRFAGRVKRLLHAGWPNGIVTAILGETVAGAVAIARQRAAGRPAANAKESRSGNDQGLRAKSMDSNSFLPESTGISPTERRNPKSMRLDRLSISSAIALFLQQDARIPAAAMKHQAAIAQAIQLIVRAFRRGGRLFYVGAGTSGRLGVLDASECPPTFRTPPEMVQGIMAGGSRALWESIEGAEDEMEVGADAIRFRGVSSKDVVVGIAASGRTPFVWGALAEARRLGAKTMILCCNPQLRFSRKIKPDVVMAIDVGPELLTGSTRLKSGTVTKLVLNLLTTLSMVKLGKVASNLMIDVNPSNTKLRGRAIRILTELTRVDDSTAEMELERTDWNVKQAWQNLKARTRERAR